MVEHCDRAILHPNHPVRLDARTALRVAVSKKTTSAEFVTRIFNLAVNAMFAPGNANALLSAEGATHRASRRAASPRHGLHRQTLFTRPACSLNIQQTSEP